MPDHKRLTPRLDSLVVALQWLGVVLVLGLLIGIVVSWGSVVVYQCG